MRPPTIAAPPPSEAIEITIAAASTWTCRKSRCAANGRATARAEANTGTSVSLPVAGTRMVLIICSPLACRQLACGGPDYGYSFASPPENAQKDIDPGQRGFRSAAARPDYRYGLPFNGPTRDARRATRRF